jgi:hypothetical protein
MSEVIEATLPESGLRQTLMKVAIFDVVHVGRVVFRVGEYSLRNFVLSLGEMIFLTPSLQVGQFAD